MLPTARHRAPGAEPERRAVPVAHDQRRGGVGVLRGRHRAVPHQRRDRLRAQALPATRRGDVAVPRRRGRSTSSSRPPACGRTSASSATNGGRQLPHPRRHRARRVHDGGQRQPVHERDGPLQHARTAAPRSNCMGESSPSRLRGGAAPPRPRRPTRSSGWSRGVRARCTMPYDERARHPPAGRQLPAAGAWDFEHTARELPRCCCTTTRSSSTASRC